MLRQVLPEALHMDLLDVSLYLEQLERVRAGEKF